MISEFHDAAGVLGRFGDENGRLEHSIGSAGLLIPGLIEIAKPGVLAWEDIDWTSGRLWTAKLPDDHALGRFLALADCQDDQAFLRYAQRYGVLTIHRFHLQPGPHERTGRQLEPLDTWRAYATMLDGMLRMAMALEEGRPASAADMAQAQLSDHWIQEQPFLPDLLADWPPVKRQRFLLACAIQRQLNDGGVRLRFDWWTDETPQVQLTYYGLYGLLGTRMMSALARAGGLVLCSGCGRIYFADRKPAQGKRAWCQRSECQKAKAAYAASNYRKTHPQKAKRKG